MVDNGQVTVSRGDGIDTIAGVGDLNLCVVEPFRQALADAVTRGSEIVVDFRQASFIDTAFVAALVMPAKSLYYRHNRMKVLVTDGGYPQYVLKIVGFADLMEIEVESA